MQELQEKQKFVCIPDCDQLVRTFGIYHNIKMNDIMVAMEYMNMGSVYGSFFHQDKIISGDCLLNNTKEEQLKSGHKQITIEKITYDEIRSIARQCLLGLDALHSCDPPIVHQDIKPQHIFLSSYGNVKIGNFSVSRRVRKESFRLSVCRGTQKYFSPEKMSKDFGVKSDIWSLGMTLMEIFNQKLILDENWDWLEVAQHGIDVYDYINISETQKKGTVSSEFVDFLQKCVAKNEQDRPSAHELLNRRFVKVSCRCDNRPFYDNLTPDQKCFDKMLQMLEKWIVEDDNQNARMFTYGEPQYLNNCVYNLARFSANIPEYVDRYIWDLYKEYTNASSS